MAVRSLTEVFILMRNNALQNRHLLSEQNTDDQAALVSYNELEKGINNSKSSSQPPPWMDALEEMQYVTTKIKQKLKELSMLHEKHVQRPAFDDNVAEERDIESLTQDITQMFTHCQRIVHRIQNSKSRDQYCGPQENRVASNVVVSLATSLQDLSVAFKTEQSSYLKRLKTREERSQQFMDSPLVTPTDGDHYTENYINQQTFNEQQLLLLEDNTERVREREKEVTHIVRSIVELNEIFKDLSHIVLEQGTVLDRIDYNVELVQSQVQQGLEQLRKAETFQRKNHKMHCIMVLAITTILLIVLLVAIKT